MDLLLDVQIDIDIKENGKTKEKLSVFLRPYTKEEAKQHEEAKNKFLDLSKKVQSLIGKANTLERKITLYEKAEQFDKAVKALEKSDAVVLDLENVTKELEALGGDDFYEAKARERFDKQVSGKGKEGLREHAETRGYLFIMRHLDEERDVIEKKLQGE